MHEVNEDASGLQDVEIELENGKKFDNLDYADYLECLFRSAKHVR